MVPDAVLRRIDDLQLSYIDALDSKDLAGWLGTFQENAADAPSEIAAAGPKV